jgi:very-short-patch-repair endonuclease
LEEIKYNDYIIRKFSHEDGFEAYYARDIAKIIGSVNERMLIKRFTNTCLVDKHQRNKYNIITHHKYNDGVRKNNKSILLTKQGLCNFLSKSRSPAADDLAKFFNINVYEHRFAPIETSTLKIIQEAFAGENMITQYQISNYRIDLYFPDHKIAVECDEYNHNDRDQEYETNREREIINNLNCKFIRYNPNADDFSIGKVINQIYRIIINTSK